MNNEIANIPFDPNKVYPRLKVNYAKNPENEVSIIANLPDGKTVNDIPMYRFLNNYVYYFIQDIGNAYKIVTTSDLPSGYTKEQLFKHAFTNLCRNVKYNMQMTIEDGIYGLLAGGDFESEGLLLDIWNVISQNLNDNIMIAAPAKSLVFFTPASNKKMVKKLIKLSKDAFWKTRETGNMQEVFTKDIFFFNKDTKEISIYKRNVL